jgi:chaperonin GroEL
LFTSNGCANLAKAIIGPSETVLFRVDDILSEDAERRYKVLKKEYDELRSSADQSMVLDQGGLKHLQRRIAKYNVVATIKVGASTKAEAMEMKDRIDDALCSITSAVNGGVSQGGGMALLRASNAVELIDKSTFKSDSAKGFTLVVDSCTFPFEILAKNTGVDIEDMSYKNLLLEDNVYDFKDCQIANWLDAGIVDPTLVPIAALTNASSVAKTILKSNSIISEWQDTTEE